MNKVQLITVIVASTLLTSVVPALAAPTLVSPGEYAEFSKVEWRCPSFHWSEVGDASYEINIRAVDQHGDEVGSKQVDRTIPLANGVTSWAPHGGQCLQRGMNYAWNVTAIDESGRRDRSEDRLFTVPVGPSVGEIAAALEILKQAQQLEAYDDQDSWQQDAIASNAIQAQIAQGGGGGGVEALVGDVPDLTGINTGVRGSVASDTNGTVGVLGSSSSVDADGVGVRGKTASRFGAGVEAQAPGSGKLFRGIALGGSEVFSVGGGGRVAAKDYTGSGALLTGITVADGAITTAKLADDAVTTPKISDGVVTSAKIANDAVTSDKILFGTIDNTDIAFNTISGNKITDGTVNSIDLADNAVITSKIVDNAVTSAKILNNSITGQDILNGSLTIAEYADRSVGPDKIDLNAITTIHIAPLAVANDDLAAGAVSTDKLLDDAVTTEKLLDEAVTTEKIAEFGVQTPNIATDAVTFQKIADNSINSARIMDGTVQATDLAEGLYRTKADLYERQSAGGGGTGLSTLTAECDDANDLPLSWFMDAGESCRIVEVDLVFWTSTTFAARAVVTTSCTQIDSRTTRINCVSVP